MKAKFMCYIILLYICTFLVGCTTKNEVVLPESNMDISPSVGEIIPSPCIISTPLDTILTPTIAPNKDSSLVRSEVEEELIASHGKIDEVKTVYFLDYMEVDHTILVQNIEWFTPWAEEDSQRIQELIDAGEIPIGEDIWGYEYYIYSKPNDTQIYHLSSDLKIVLRGGTRSIWSYYDLSTLSEMQDKLLTDLYIKEDIVYMLYEPYTP